MVMKNLLFSCKKYKNLKQNGQKQFKNKSLANFFVFREEGQLKESTLIGGFAVFKLLVVLSITKLYMHDITFSDICKFLVCEF